MTVWAKLHGESYLGEEKMDIKFVPISNHDRGLLEIALHAELAEDGGEDWYYLERLEATHFGIMVSIPDGTEGTDYDDESTWWDFSCVLMKQVDGDWYAWSEDPGDTGNIWYQSTYTKIEAYGVRDLCVEVAESGGLYNPVDESRTYDYLTRVFGELVQERVMTWWSV